MKKYLWPAAAAFAGLIIGIFIFFPWNTLGSALLSIAAGEAASRGIFLTASSSEVSGVLSKTFFYRGITADLPAARVTVSGAGIEPALLSSLTSGGAKAHITFGRGSVVPVTRQAIEWDGGEADVFVTQESVAVSGISFTGPTSLSGSLEIRRASMTLAACRLTVKAPPELDGMFEMLRMANLLPLKKIKEGEWRIER